MGECNQVWISTNPLDSFSSIILFQPSPRQQSDLLPNTHFLKSRDERNSHSTWGSVPSHYSQSLWLSSLLPAEEIPQLQLPHLEMLELRETSLRFPTWMLVPPTIKLFTFNIYSNLPAIIELWINNLFGWGTLSSRYPTL